MRPKHDQRGVDGQYASTPPCDGCGKPVGTDHCTDYEVCGNGDGPGFYLCERKRCVARREALSVVERRALYERTRTARAAPTEVT